MADFQVEISATPQSLEAFRKSVKKALTDIPLTVSENSTAGLRHQIERDVQARIQILPKGVGKFHDEIKDRLGQRDRINIPITTDLLKIQKELEALSQTEIKVRVNIDNTTLNDFKVTLDKVEAQFLDLVAVEERFVSKTQDQIPLAQASISRLNAELLKTVEIFGSLQSAASKPIGAAVSAVETKGSVRDEKGRFIKKGSVTSPTTGGPSQEFLSNLQASRQSLATYIAGLRSATAATEKLLATGIEKTFKVDLQISNDSVASLARINQELIGQFEAMSVAKDKFAANVDDKFPKIAGKVELTNVQLAETIALLTKAKEIGNFGVKPAPKSEVNAVIKTTRNTKETQEDTKANRELTKELKVQARVIQEQANALLQQKRRLDASADAAARATETTGKFGERIGFSAARLAAYLVPAAGIFQLANLFRFAATEAVGLNTQINKLQQVLDGSAERAENLSRSVLKSATAYGQNGRELIRNCQYISSSWRCFWWRSGYC
jgi:hypothetical protein